MFTIYDLTLFFLASLLVAYWWRISGQKDHALAKARQHCTSSEHQLLDQTLVFLQHRLEKDALGKKHLCRVYEFDFCKKGEENYEIRYKGEIMLAGFSIIRIVLESDHLEVTEF